MLAVSFFLEGYAFSFVNLYFFLRGKYLDVGSGALEGKGSGVAFSCLFMTMFRFYFSSLEAGFTTPYVTNGLLLRVALTCS